MKNFIQNILPLSRDNKGASHTFIRKQSEAGQYLVGRPREFELDVSKEKTWDPHVHALKELVPQNNRLNIYQANLQALTSNSGLITRRKSKIGCSKVCNTLSIKINETKKDNSKGTKERILTPWSRLVKEYLRK